MSSIYLFMVVCVSLLLLVWNGRTEWCNSETAACCMYPEFIRLYELLSVTAPCSENKQNAKKTKQQRLCGCCLDVISECGLPERLQADVTVIINMVLMC